jgi:flavin-dependent dehydrogenase
VQEYDFIFDVHGRGWHLDRGRFDSMLVDTAVAAGALWSADTWVLGSARSAEGWRLDLHTRGRAWSTSARVVVDASGRPATFARARTPRAHHDHLVGLSLRFAADPEGLPGNVTLVESVPEGWWYSAPLPGGQAIVVFMTDADLVPRPAASRPTELRRLLTAAPCTDARLRGCVPDGTVRVVAAGSATLARAAGDRWLAVGDAAAAYDPLSSQGIITRARDRPAGRPGGP